MTYETLRVISAGGHTEASFVPTLNMVCCSLQHDGTELLDLRRGLQMYADAGKTMGIPLLYPWANRLSRLGYEAGGKSVDLSDADAQIPRDSQGLPIHGVLPRLLKWEVGGGSEDNTITARLMWNSRKLLELFPYRHEVHRTVSVTDGELIIETEVHANHGDRVPVSFGYHPYLRVPDEKRSAWHVSLGAQERLLLDAAMIPTGGREPVDRRRFTLAERDLDDAFAALDQPASFEAAAGDIALRVDFLGGYSYAQVFAPADQDFICFEPMTAPANALVSGDGLIFVAPGERYRAAFRVSLFARS
jgi:galactose mutarotase-like enzyme